ncbi:hypothetical protein FA15DRAFT_685769 [Coprinopsis marcescibilis]|uniref:Septin-type G domain-containing protein n=1 Tax=Coprinopsis marcescibilis TaxID=230819 RepID=A0A5C3L6D3_COPMA|nr:hypothetical protein FA15DRAFT_685769 [Coprinopsis marcescibilis]
MFRPPSFNRPPGSARPEFTLLVAGCRGGKTSFLRLLLDTSDVSPTTSQDQLASVAKFVQGCAGHTTFIRTASVDIDTHSDGPTGRRCLGLNLIDTPSFDHRDEQDAERLMSDIVHHIDSRFGEGLEDEWKARSGDRYVHLCIYFLDPDQIVPPSVPGPPVPVIPRARNGSFSQSEEPVILEPPVSTNNAYLRAVLPKTDITAIRRLSGRVNVLPVISRADVLSNERLAAIKMAIRRDLAEAGIGFGIFDLPDDRAEPANGYGSHPNGTSNSNRNSPPASPTVPTLRLPYALVSPDLYGHSDGVPRKAASRHELMQQYAGQVGLLSKFSRGKFIRAYRWGTLDVLDPNHSDFLSLRSAIFHHMETLQNYTKEYLFSKFRQEVDLRQQQQRPNSRHPIPPASMISSSRPPLLIDTAPQTVHRHPPPLNVPVHHSEHLPAPRPIQDNGASSASSVKSTGRPSKVRPKKITVACNFCRSRKLKCDGGRPACSQCTKRSNPCDYQPQTKRRGTVGSRTQRSKGEESDSESGGERSPEPSLSPQVSSQSVSRRSSNVEKLHPDGYQPHNTLPPLNDRYSSGVGPSINNLTTGPHPHSAPPPPVSRPKLVHPNDHTPHGYYEPTELPRITTMLPENQPSTPAPMSAPNISLAPIRPASGEQAAMRKRAATLPNNKTSRLSGGSGPKVVACNFCRARKTKCDGAQPACASCARRQLDCNYVHDNGHAKKRRASTSKPIIDSPESLSPPSSRMAPTPSDMSRDAGHHLDDDTDMKRPMDHSDYGRAAKKMRMDDSVSVAQ